MRLSLSEAIKTTTDARVARILSLFTGSGHMASGAWRTEIPLSAASKKAGYTAHKIVYVFREMRIGLEYKNLAQNEDIETGEIHDWQEWEMYPFILRHKKAGTKYLRINMSEDLGKARTTYFLNGQECDKADLQNYMTAGAWEKMNAKPTGGPTLTIQKKIDEILEINGVAV